MKVEFLIVGAGFAGCTLAERIASQYDKKVLLVDRRSHVGGNAYDFYNDEGLLVQKYGPHIFHTNTREVWEYLSQFTQWNSYVHRVLASVNGEEVYLPINLNTMSTLYNRDFTPEEMKGFLEKKRIALSEIRNSRDAVLSQVGEELYDLLFKNYTKKQWGVYPEELDAQVTSRLHVRFNADTRYFTDRYQGIPKHGFSKMFEAMASHKNIHLLLNTDYKDVLGLVKFNKQIFTGPIDYYFDYLYGKLPYRSLDFRFETHDVERYQRAAVVNYPNNHDYTRITEFKHFYFQKHEKTTICYEYPRAEGDPYYPIPKADFLEIYKKYKQESNKLKNTYFIGRLAEYTYLNMDQVVERALAVLKDIQ
jgi:UDP-galactopyranose mutase